MMRPMRIFFTPSRFAALGGLSLALGLMTSPAQAAVDSETAYILNSFLMLICGALVMFMAAGFCMLEAGMVRTKNVATICLKNMALYCVAGLLYFLIGYDLMYTDVSGFIGTFSVWGAEDAAAASGDFDAGSTSAAGWFFQMVFVATAASIVSGTVAERIRLWPFLIFVAVLTGLIYPITGSWKWGEGWLHELGFSDFAGSTLVHAVGGFAALTGAIIVGPRIGKFASSGHVQPMPGSSMPLAALGTFILWLGWFGFNGGSQLTMSSSGDILAISIIFVNTNLAAAAGFIVAMALSQILYRKVDLTLALNGALAGLVSITAAPDSPGLFLTCGIGAVGGLLTILTVPLLDKLKIDDVVGAIPVHLVCGIWGTIAVAFSYRHEYEGANGETLSYSFLEQLGVQALGIAAIGGFVLVTSAAVWLILKITIGIRASKDEELQGLDLGELGMEAYPEFTGSGR